MTCICGYQWCWLCKSKYTDYHYKPWNVFGWASMQYTENWSKCAILLYYLVLIVALFPVFMLCCPLIFMVVGVYKPLERYNNDFAKWCIIPYWMAKDRYRLRWKQKWCLTIWYLPCVLVFGLIFGITFCALWYTCAIFVTCFKMAKLSLRDCRWFKSKV